MSKSILVVEDQEDNRQIIRDMLTFTDYEIVEAESGEEALAAVAKQRPDLILMDIQLRAPGWKRRSIDFRFLLQSSHTAGLERSRSELLPELLSDRAARVGIGQNQRREAVDFMRAKVHLSGCSGTRANGQNRFCRPDY